MVFLPKIGNFEDIFSYIFTFRNENVKIVKNNLKLDLVN